MAVASAHTAPSVDRSSLLSIGEVAEWLRISDKTIRRLVGRGDLAVVYVGGQLRFEPGAVQRYIERHSRGG